MKLKAMVKQLESFQNLWKKIKIFAKYYAPSINYILDLASTLDPPLLHLSLR